MTFCFGVSREMFGNWCVSFWRVEDLLGWMLCFGIYISDFTGKNVLFWSILKCCRLLFIGFCNVIFYSVIQLTLTHLCPWILFTLMLILILEGGLVQTKFGVLPRSSLGIDRKIFIVLWYLDGIFTKAKFL